MDENDYAHVYMHDSSVHAIMNICMVLHKASTVFSYDGRSELGGTYQGTWQPQIAPSEATRPTALQPSAPECAGRLLHLQLHT